MPQNITDLENPIGAGMDRDGVLADLMNEAETENESGPRAGLGNGESRTGEAIRTSQFLQDAPIEDKPQEATPATDTPVTPAPGNEQQVDESGNAIGPVPYERFKEINDRLKSFETKAELHDKIDPAYRAVAEYFGTDDPQVIAQAIAETKRQEAERLQRDQLAAKWNENAVAFGEDAANVMRDTQLQQLQTQAELNNIRQMSRGYEVERTLSTLRDVVKDPVAMKEVELMVNSSPTEYLPKLVSQLKTVASAIENKTRAEYAARKQEDGRQVAPVSGSGGRPPAAPRPDSGQQNGGSFSFSTWLKDQMTGGNSA